jgi:ankyrin repeat protein
MSNAQEKLQSREVSEARTSAAPSPPQSPTMQRQLSVAVPKSPNMVTALGSGAYLYTFDSKYPLHDIAADSTRVEALRAALLRQDTVVDEVNAEEQTPLFVAATFGNVGAIAVLLEAGAAVDAVCGEEGRTPLHGAVVAGQVLAITALIRAGADCSARTADGETPLALAVFGGEADVVATLLEHAKGRLCVEDGAPYAGTPLFIAAMNNRTAIVRHLLAAGARTDVVDGDGWTPLHFAAMDDNEPLVVALLGAGCPADALNHDGLPPLHYAAMNNRAATQVRLVAAGVNLNYDPRGDATPLMVAAKNGRLELVRLLLDHGADPTVRSPEGLTAVDYAENGMHSLVAAYLRTALARANGKLR